MTGQEQNHELVTITGLVIPAQWGPVGEVVAVAIAAFDERTYPVATDSRSLKLVGMLHRQVTVVGRVTTNVGGEKMIQIRKIKAERSPRLAVTTLAVMMLAGVMFLAGAVGTAWADQSKTSTATPAVKKPDAQADQSAVKKAAKPAVKKAATAKKVKATKKGVKSNPKLAAVQKALAKAGFKCKADGFLGKKTRLALRKYQKSKGLKVTGKPDKATLKALGLS